MREMSMVQQRVDAEQRRAISERRSPQGIVGNLRHPRAYIGYELLVPLRRNAIIPLVAEIKRPELEDAFERVREFAEARPDEIGASSNGQVQPGFEIRWHRSPLATSRPEQPIRSGEPPFTIFA